MSVKIIVNFHISYQDFLLEIYNDYKSFLRSSSLVAILHLLSNHISFSQNSTPGFLKKKLKKKNYICEENILKMLNPKKRASQPRSCVRETYTTDPWIMSPLD